ncbi:TlpA family protein disulfide reductase [Nonomuraea guangzhouensis]|uniref:TlpA family protein disulfide reductase n=1 Tax=Nonomuraea guangzhouensis TaxID=1291555 RepID=A0ABW4GRX4_9ACTN|nr:MauE/DoxX family redox-associated membrane protein [Nonomuraea guangzhouensis]
MIVLASAYAALIAVLLYAAVSKARDLPGFAADIAGYQLIPQRLTLAAAVAVVSAELAAAGLLTAPATRRWGALLAAVLFAAFLAAMASVLRRGLSVGCGCFGDRDLVGPATVTRTGLLAALAVMAAVAGPFPFSFVHLLVGAAYLALTFLPARLIGAAERSRVGPRPGTHWDVTPQALTAEKLGILYALIAPTCGVCSAMLPAFVAAEQVDVVLVSAAEEGQVRDYLAAHEVELPLVIDPGVFDRHGIPWPPYAVLTDRQGVVLAAGGAAEPGALDALLGNLPRVT